jgi:hypothetical protein
MDFTRTTLIVLDVALTHGSLPCRMSLLTQVTVGDVASHTRKAFPLCSWSKTSLKPLCLSKLNTNHMLKEKSLQKAGLWRKWSYSVRHDLEHIYMSTIL